MTQVTIKLPWPPSVNRMWRTISKGRLAGRTLLSKEGRDYRKDVSENVLLQRIPRHTLSGKLSVRIYACPPDHRARDLDNLPKGVLDGLKLAGVIADDRFVDELHITREHVVAHGSITVVITEIVCPSTESHELFAAA